MHFGHGGIAVGALMALAVSGNASAETIRIGIGHQSMCTDTYSAGIIVKELGLMEKHLPRDGKYADAEYDFQWKDYTSGPPITNMMLANKLDFGVMGDYPLIVNGAKFQQTESLRTLYVAGTGYNMHGSGNAIVVPVSSDIYSFEQLKGKDISVPVGSAAWGMVLKAMQDHGMSEDAVEIKNQSPPVGAANIASNKIAAHADFCPWSEIMEFRGTGRKIYDGSQTGVPYLHGVVVREDYAKRYPEIVVAFGKAIIDAGDWVREDPARAAEKLEKWTGVEKEVQYLYFGRGGHLTLDPTIKPKWVETLQYDHSVLAEGKNIPPLDFEQWIDDTYIREAYRAMGLDYEQQLAEMHDPAEVHDSLPQGEIWHAAKGIITYESISAMLSAASELQQSGQKINATYVYDKSTGLKLFGKVAFFVEKADGVVVAFMRKPDADAFSAEVGGRVLTYDEILADGTEVAVGSRSDAGSLALLR